MRKLLVAVSAFFLIFTTAAHAESKKDTAFRLVQEAKAHYDAVGDAQARKDFSEKGGKFYFDEFYIFMTSTPDGVTLFHAANPKLEGRNFLKLKDSKGKLFVQEIVDVISSDGKGWVGYHWVHPETKKIAEKNTYNEISSDGKFYFSVGYYK